MFTMQPEMKFEMFRGGSFTSWDALFQQVADFATSLGRDRVVSISQSEDQNDAVIVVWYWSE
jgi:hypothetical protein